MRVNFLNYDNVILDFDRVILDSNSVKKNAIREASSVFLSDKKLKDFIEYFVYNNVDCLFFDFF